MSYKGEKLGAFIVPTGIGASIGGYAGDAGAYARKFADKSLLIVNPNVVNAGAFSAINDNMLYVEGYSLNEYFKGNLNLLPAKKNNLGIVYDKAIPQNVLNIHINTHNAIKSVYGINIKDYTITDEIVGVNFSLAKTGNSTGQVKNLSTIKRAVSRLIKSGCNAIAIVCMFNDPEQDNPSYAQGVGVDPVGGVEAIISHSISKEFEIPCAHSPAFEDYSIQPKLVNPKAAAEYITPTFLPCILIGLENAPLLSKSNSWGISIDDLDYLVMPWDALGSIPVIESIKRKIPVFAVKENSTVLNVTNKILYNSSYIIEIPTYKDVLREI